MSQLELGNEPSQAAPLARNINEPARAGPSRAELARYPALIVVLWMLQSGILWP